MQVLMSDSLLNRVSAEMPTREKLLASFVFAESEITTPVAAVFWHNGRIQAISLGLNDIDSVSKLIKSDEQIDLAIKDLEIYLENIFKSSYNLVEHNNYSYEISFRLEDDNG